MGKLIMDAINVIGAAASVIGLLITGVVFWRVRSIEKRFSAQGLLPGYQSTLRGAVKNLEEHQRSKNGPKIRTVLSGVRATLKDMATCLDKRRAKDVQQVIASITRRLESSDDALCAGSGSAIADLEEVQQTVQNYVKVIQWSARNA